MDRESIKGIYSLELLVNNSDYDLKEDLSMNVYLPKSFTTGGTVLCRIFALLLSLRESSSHR